MEWSAGRVSLARAGADQTLADEMRLVSFSESVNLALLNLGVFPLQEIL